MSEEKWVLDATLAGDDDGGVFPFCPLTEDGDVMVGLTYVSDAPPGEFVGVAHADGQEACDRWCEAHPEVIARLAGTSS